MSEEDKNTPPKPPPPSLEVKPAAPPVRKSFDGPVKQPASESSAAPVEEKDEESYDNGVPFQNRVISLLIDCVLAGGLAMAVDMLLPNVLGTLAALAYIVTRDSLPFLNGQSIGKAVMGYKAVTERGDSLAGDWKTGAIRNAPLVIPFFPAVECAILLTREDKVEHGRRLGDDWAKTKVVPTKALVKQESDEEEEA